MRTRRCGSPIGSRSALPARCGPSTSAGRTGSRGAWRRDTSGSTDPRGTSGGAFGGFKDSGVGREERTAELHSGEGSQRDPRLRQSRRPPARTAGSGQLGGQAAARLGQKRRVPFLLLLRHPGQRHGDGDRAEDALQWCTIATPVEETPSSLSPELRAYPRARARSGSASRSQRRVIVCPVTAGSRTGPARPGTPVSPDPESRTRSDVSSAIALT